MSNDKLKTLLDSQRRSIQLVTARRKLLEKSVVFWEQQQYEGAGEQPFFYSAMGSDGEVGIEIQRDDTGALLFKTVWNDITFSAPATIQEDAPFVWTNVGITLREIRDYTNLTTPAQKETLDASSIFRSTYVNASTISPDLQVGFVDKSSGRVLFQSERFEDGTTQRPAGLIPTRAMNINKQKTSFVQGAPGHGPMGLWTLPQEVLLPSSATLEIMIQSQTVPAATLDQANWKDNFRYRAYITLGGYKVAA